MIVHPDRIGARSPGE